MNLPPLIDKRKFIFVFGQCKAYVLLFLDEKINVFQDKTYILLPDQTQFHVWIHD